MNLSLSDKISLLAKLGNYIRSENEEWKTVKEKATLYNSWFIPEFVENATEAIGSRFLQEDELKKWLQNYAITTPVKNPKQVGIVMAGNLPAVGFHDFLCGFLSGHRLTLKLSSKDKILIPHFIEKLNAWEPATGAYIRTADMLKDCDAYIATGSNNSARYFNQYFGKYPHIIRRNRTSVAVLDGGETGEELDSLADDMLMYFGRGCRNVTKLFVPEGYDFIPLLEAVKKYDYLRDIHHYKNNFDYQLSLLLLNRTYYMSNEVILMKQHPSFFSAVGVVHYDFYSDKEKLLQSFAENEDLQCIVGHENIPFGQAQLPRLQDNADGVDTLSFLAAL